MTYLPEPLTPKGIRGTSLGPMPLDVDWWTRVEWAVTSATFKEVTLNLMVSAWRQDPAASVANMPDRLWRIAQSKPSTWKRVGAEVLRPWVLCSDNRLYHPWLAEQVRRRVRSGGGGQRNGVSASEWRVLRGAVFERDDYTCTYCGKRGGVLECDHVIPVSAGGSGEISNLTTACRACNGSKSGKPVHLWRVA